jgi:hypothetical protein
MGTGVLPGFNFDRDLAIDHPPHLALRFFFLSFNLLIGWQFSIWHYCKPFFSLLYN